MKSLLALLAIAPTVALACLNDRDTLAFEKRNVEIVGQISKEQNDRKRTYAIQELALRAIGGRFERFPKGYYQARIDRLRAKKSLTTSEYDDLAVAYDRIGDVETAIKVIRESKNLRLTSDDKYRFHANFGTFLVHKWILDGRTNVSDLKQSVAEIETAIKINPNSHFGREAVQLDLQKEWLNEVEGGPKWTRKVKPEPYLVGLSGIVMMGLGYELPDVYARMSKFNLPGQAAETMTDKFAAMRYADLLSQGIKPISKVEPEDIEADKDVKVAYRELLEDGDRVHKARTEYINERLAKGNHPDTHPKFWSEWSEAPFPVLIAEESPMPMKSQTVSATLIAAACLVVLTIGGLAIFLVKRLIRR